MLSYFIESLERVCQRLKSVVPYAARPPMPLRCSRRRCFNGLVAVGFLPPQKTFSPAPALRKRHSILHPVRLVPPAFCRRLPALRIDLGVFVVRGGQAQEAVAAALERKGRMGFAVGESGQPSVAELPGEGDLSREAGGLLHLGWWKACCKLFVFFYFLVCRAHRIVRGNVSMCESHAQVFSAVVGRKPATLFTLLSCIWPRGGKLLSMIVLVKYVSAACLLYCTRAFF